MKQVLMSWSLSEIAGFPSNLCPLHLGKVGMKADAWNTNNILDLTNKSYVSVDSHCLVCQGGFVLLSMLFHPTSKCFCNEACSPGIHYWNYYLGAPSVIQVAATHLKIKDPLNFKWAAVTSQQWECTRIGVSEMTTRQYTLFVHQWFMVSF